MEGVTDLKKLAEAGIKHLDSPRSVPHSLTHSVIPAYGGV